MSWYMKIPLLKYLRFWDLMRLILEGWQYIFTWQKKTFTWAHSPVEDIVFHAHIISVSQTDAGGVALLEATAGDDQRGLRTALPHGIHRKCRTAVLHSGVAKLTHVLETGLVDTHIACKNHPLQWRHNGHDGVSNHQPYDCLLKRLFRRRSKKASTLVQVTACSRIAPSHYLNQCRIISEIQWYLRGNSQDIPHPSISKISLKITNLSFHSAIPRDNELINVEHWFNN